MFRKKSKPEEREETPAEPKLPKIGATGQSPERADQPGRTALSGVAQEQSHQLALDESGLMSCYANFCRVTGTPEEVILDLGLNPQSIGSSGSRVQVSQRIIFNYYTAKRMLAALQVTVARHEQAFGPIETDVQKRATEQQRTIGRTSSQ